MMREVAIQEFLQSCGWQDAHIEPVAGDASARRYFRLTKGGHSRLLMDACPTHVPSQQPFVDTAAHLRRIGLCAPEVFHTNIPAGLLLIEDLGNLPLPIAISNFHVSEKESYLCAVDVLIHLQNAPAPDWLTPYGPQEMVAALEPFFSEVSPDISAETKAAIAEEMEQLLTRYCTDQNVMILRDFHAENILWQPKATALRRAGLIDFQDALLSHPVYDFISLLKDARRTIEAPTETAMIQHFLNATDMDAEQFSVCSALLTLQRNLRILGLFHRLARHGSRGYLDLAPRVMGYISDSLRHGALRGLGQALDPYLPTIGRADT